MRRSFAMFRPLAVPVAFICFVVAGSPAGCKSMTTGKELQLAREDKERAEREAADLKAQELRRNEVERQRAGRAVARADASRLLAAGDADGALGKLEQVYNPPAEVRSDPSTGKEEMVIPEIAGLDAAEEADVFMLRGLAHHQAGRSEEAIGAFRSAVERDPEARSPRRNLGKLLFLEKRYADALEAWKPELAAGYRDAEILFLAAQARYELGTAAGVPAELEAARVAMEEVLIERPRDPEVSRWLGRLEYETGRYAEAIRHFEAIRTDNPLDPDYLELIGICHFKLGERRRALDFLQLSSRLKLPDRDGAQILGELLEAEGLPGQAADWLLRVHGSEPREAPARERARIGRLLAESGRAEEAAAWLGALSEDEDQYSEAQSLLGPVYLALARVDEAAAALENARRLRPQDGPAQLAAGDLQLQRGDLKLALDAYAKASGLPRTQARGLAGLAEVAYAAGNLQAAVAYYEKAVAAGPGEARFQRVLERLQQELRVQREEEAGAAAGEPPADGERAAGG